MINSHEVLSWGETQFSSTDSCPIRHTHYQAFSSQTKVAKKFNDILSLRIYFQNESRSLSSTIAYIWLNHIKCCFSWYKTVFLWEIGMLNIWKKLLLNLWRGYLKTRRGGKKSGQEIWKNRKSMSKDRIWHKTWRHQ